jgi:hypothetical protein
VQIKAIIVREVQKWGNTLSGNKGDRYSGGHIYIYLFVTFAPILFLLILFINVQSINSEQNFIEFINLRCNDWVLSFPFISISL